MITVGTRSYIGNQIYDYQGELAQGKKQNAAALEDNQAFASRLFAAMNKKEEPAKEEPAEEKPYSDLAMNGVEEETVLSYILKMREHMRDICGKVMTGNAQPSFQIGSSTFTQEEWEEFLSRFDSVEDAMQAAMRAEYEKDDTSAVRTNAAGTSIADPEKAQAVLDPAVTKTEPLPAFGARQSYPVQEKEMERAQAEAETAQKEPYWNMFWQGRV